jgi:HlyD family secretion protein
MLAGSSFARVHVPASQRPAIRIGMRCELTVTGMPKPFTTQVRSISSDPAFTPYFALTGDDASRLSYRAELVLDAGDTGSLAAGLPVQARCGDAAAAR